MGVFLIIIFLFLAVVMFIPYDRGFLEGARSILIGIFAIGLIGGLGIEIKNPGTFGTLAGFSKADVTHNEWISWGAFFGFYLIPLFQIRLFISLINLTLKQNKSSEPPHVAKNEPSLEESHPHPKSKPSLKLRTKLKIDEAIESINNWIEDQETLNVEEVDKKEIYGIKTVDITISSKEMIHYVWINEKGVLELRSMDHKRGIALETPEEILEGIKEAIGHQ